MQKPGGPVIKVIEDVEFLVNRCDEHIAVEFPIFLATNDCPGAIIARDRVLIVLSSAAPSENAVPLSPVFRSTPTRYNGRVRRRRRGRRDGAETGQHAMAIKSLLDRFKKGLSKTAQLFNVRPGSAGRSTSRSSTTWRPG